MIVSCWKQLIQYKVFTDHKISSQNNNYTNLTNELREMIIISSKDLISEQASKITI